MSESTLSVDYTSLRQVVAQFLGLGLDSSNWTDEEGDQIDIIIAAGLRQFYFPPKIRDDEEPHEFSFLKPTTTITTIATYSTGTVEVSSGTCTLSDGTWPSWAATHGILTIDSTEYSITSRDGDSTLTVVGDDVTAGEDYTLQHNGNYDMDDDFGGVEGPLHHSSANNYREVKVVGEGAIRDIRTGTTTRSKPLFAAVRPKECDGSEGQRFEMMFVPIPDDAYPLTYRMIILVNTLTSANPNPLGGMPHAETVRASCLAAAEFEMEDKKGVRWEHFAQRLTASIAHDKKAIRQEYFGYNRDNSDGLSFPRNRVNGLVTYEGS